MTSLYEMSLTKHGTRLLLIRMIFEIYDEHYYQPIPASTEFFMSWAEDD